MAEVFYIVNWPYHEHRDIPKRVRWIKAKVDFQGVDWAKLARERYASDALAAWEIVRGVAVLSPYRGLLLQDGHDPRPHTIETMALQSRWRVPALRRGMAILVDVLGWVGVCELDSDARTLSKRLYRKVYADAAMRSREIPGNSGKIPGNSGKIPKTPRLHNINSNNNKRLKGVGDFEAKSEPKEDVLTAWNETAKAASLRTARSLNDGRRRAIAARMKSAEWREGWRGALSKVQGSAFCGGENDRGWVANLDWFLRPGTVMKLLEGQYDGSARTARKAQLGSQTSGGRSRAEYEGAETVVNTDG